MLLGESSNALKRTMTFVIFLEIAVARTARKMHLIAILNSTENSATNHWYRLRRYNKINTFLPNYYRFKKMCERAVLLEDRLSFFSFVG